MLRYWWCSLVAILTRIGEVERLHFSSMLAVF
jgi:hypothetical protein